MVSYVFIAALVAKCCCLFVFCLFIFYVFIFYCIYMCNLCNILYGMLYIYIYIYMLHAHPNELTTAFVMIIPIIIILTYLSVVIKLLLMFYNVPTSNFYIYICGIQL